MAFIAALSFQAGSASAIFLRGLDALTNLRNQTNLLWLFLPTLGILFQWFKQKFPELHHTGTNQYLALVQEKEKKTSAFFSIYILCSTWLSHLAGASVGREGTAVQIGASISEQLHKLFPSHQKSVWIRAGIAAGFSSVFGTPWAGALFGLEINKVGGLSTKSIIPSFLSAFGANWVCIHVYGTNHTQYPPVFLPAINLQFWLHLAILGIFLGLLGFVYKALESNIYKWSEQLPKHFILKGIFSGLLVFLLIQIPGFQSSAGLSGELLTKPFHSGFDSFFFLKKLLATAASLGLGFKGGEATPLFLIGSHAGAFASNYLMLPISLAAAAGFVSVYAGLAKTPLTGMLLGMELFSPDAWFIYLLVTIFVMYFSGKNGLFKQQEWSTKLPKPFY